MAWRGRSKNYSQAYPMEALLDKRLPLPESAAQEQWYSPKYSSTWSRVISTEANVYRTPVSGSTCSDIDEGVTTSELQLEMRVGKTVFKRGSKKKSNCDNL